MNDFESRGWFTVFILLLSFIASSVLATDVATDYLEAFVDGRASSYFVMWEIAEIAFLAGISGWLLHKINQEGGLIGFILVGALPTTALLFPEWIAGGELIEWVTGSGCVVFMICLIVKWDKTPLGTQKEQFQGGIQDM